MVNNPNIRFAGFADDWVQCEFSNLAKVRRGLTYKPSDVRDYGIRVLRSSNIAEDTFLIKSDDVFVNKEAVKIDKVKNGDILITSANGSSRLVGKHALIKGVNDDTVHGGFMLVARAKNPEFVNATMSSSWYSKFINNFVSGGNGAIGNLSKSNLEDQKVYVPSEKEQQKIGSVFSTLDHKIGLEERQISLLKDLKKGYLQKMFPKNGAKVPELRFAGFADDWEERKLGELLTAIKRPIKMQDDDTYQLVTVKRRNEGIVSRGLFKGSQILVKNYFELHAGDYLISKRQVVHGANGIVPKDMEGAIVSNEYLVSVGNKNITTDFLTIISKLPIMYKMFFLSSYGIDIEKLVFNVNDWKKREISIPSLQEQNRISSFFKQLDNALTLHQRKLDLLKDLKKGLSQQMFV